MATVETNNYTPEDLLAMPDDGRSYELVDGNLVEVNVSALSNWVGGQLFRRVDDFATRTDQGLTWPPESGLQCYAAAPNRVRRADTFFVRKDRLPPDWQDQGFVRVVPDLAAEVLSPNDSAYEVDEKLQEYLEAGVRLVWIINPETRTVRIHRADGTFGWLTDRDELDGEDVLPGFRCPVRELFPPETTGPQASSGKT